MASFGQIARTLSVAAATAAIAVGAASAGTLDKVREDKTVRLGVRADAPPFSYKDANGDPAGFMVDLCRAVATGPGPRRRHPERRAPPPGRPSAGCS